MLKNFSCKNLKKYWDKYLQDVNLCELVKMLHPPEIQTLVPLGGKSLSHRGKMMLFWEHILMYIWWTLKFYNICFYRNAIKLEFSVTHLQIIANKDLNER